MPLIRCTQKLLKELRVKPSGVETAFGSIGSRSAQRPRQKGGMQASTLYFYSVDKIEKPISKIGDRF